MFFCPAGSIRHWKEGWGHEKKIPKWTTLKCSFLPFLGRRIQNLGVSKNRGTPKSSILIGVFHYKPSILGYPYFWKHPPVFFLIPPKKNKCHLVVRTTGSPSLKACAPGVRPSPRQSRDPITTWVIFEVKKHISFLVFRIGYTRNFFRMIECIGKRFLHQTRIWNKLWKGRTLSDWAWETKLFWFFPHKTAWKFVASSSIIFQQKCLEFPGKQSLGSLVCYTQLVLSDWVISE